VPRARLGTLRKGRTCLDAQFIPGPLENVRRFGVCTEKLLQRGLVGQADPFRDFGPAKWCPAKLGKAPQKPPPIPCSPQYFRAGQDLPQIGRLEPRSRLFEALAFLSRPKDREPPKDTFRCSTALHQSPYHTSFSIHTALVSGPGDCPGPAKSNMRWNTHRKKTFHKPAKPAML
jgi:hypothetical protein